MSTQNHVKHFSDVQLNSSLHIPVTSRLWETKVLVSTVCDFFFFQSTVGYGSDWRWSLVKHSDMSPFSSTHKGSKQMEDPFLYAPGLHSLACTVQTREHIWMGQMLTFAVWSSGICKWECYIRFRIYYCRKTYLQRWWFANKSINDRSM